jgi:hypothetical protein
MFLNTRLLRTYAVGLSRAVLVMVAFATIFSTLTFAQSTISTGSVQGTVTDPSGAVVGGAKVTIINKQTGQQLTFVTSSAGVYSSGSMIPGAYQVRVEANGFRTSELPVIVQVGTTAQGNLSLQLGQGNEIVEVQGSQVQVNTEQATVGGVITPEQIQNLPINGRNFLDLAQLQPGVQVQDGAGFDPTKNGFMSISIGGRAGRTARIMVDGVDISDENVGTTTQDIPASGIQEFQIAQSSLDLSTSLTSTGSVNVTTKSGGNAYHGDGFYAFRDKGLGFASFPGGIAPYFQRNQAGGDFGGPIIKDKVFFFVDAEHTKQDFGNAVVFDDPFANLNGSYDAPYRETNLLGKLDWTIRSNMHAFYRFTYNNNSDLKPANNFSPFLNRNNTPAHAIGLDFNNGSYTHSIRFGYSKFVNGISPATGGGLINPDPTLNLNISSLQTGPNTDAPQATLQSNKQIKYDGSKTWKNHIFRYGVGVNRIVGGGFAAFGALGAQVFAEATPTNEAAILANPSAYAPALSSGGAPTDNPLNYPVTSLTIFNGQGFFGEKPSFGYPHGGLFDTRFEAYAGDAWKAKPNLTINYGLHYVRDVGRSDSDLPAIPFMNQFGAGLGDKVNQPNLNFSPELGIAWDPFKNGKTVLRAGAGLYYENTIWNDVLFDRVLRLQQGLFFGDEGLCGASGGALTFPDGSSVTTSDGLNIGTQICGNAPSTTPIAGGVTVAKAITDLQNSFQAATVAAGPAQNGLFVGNLGSTLASMLAPDYVSPRSFQLNLGFQRQIANSTVLTVDYIRNEGRHFLLGVDENHVGAARNLNVPNALAAINTTLAANAPGCGQVTMSTVQAGINCYIAAVPGASITDFAGNGLDLGGTFANPTAAFPGNNPAVGQGIVFQPIGDSSYNALQLSLRSNVNHPLPAVKRMDLQISYALSRFENNVPGTANPGQQVLGDQDFLNNAVDFDNPNHYMGPASMDRTHQLSFGPIFYLPTGLRLSFIGHLDSPLPLTMLLPELGGGGQPGEIFRSDVTGDGTVGDVVPGSNVGAFGRSVGASDLNGFIDKYNATNAGKLTPAGTAVVSAGLFSAAQMAALGAVTPTIADAPPGNVGMGWLKSIDLGMAWDLKVKEGITVQPSFTVFNLFNFANFDGPITQLTGRLDASSDAINTVTSATRSADRTGPGSGVFSLGAPRQIEFGLKVSF